MHIDKRSRVVNGSFIQQMPNLELLAKLRQKQRGLASVRRSGGRMQSKQTMNNMSADEPDDDMFKDMKGMKKKDMKKAMGSMVDGMDDKQVEAMVTNMQGKLPPAQAHEMTKFIRSKHALAKKKQSEGIQVNAKTVHKEVSDLTEEEKEKRRQVKPEKKPRSFQEMNISMPKLSDLSNVSTEATETKEDEKGTKDSKAEQVSNGPHMIPEMGDIMVEAPDDADAIRDIFISKDSYTIEDQMKALKAFKASEWNVNCKELTVQQGHQFPVVKVDTVDMVKIDDPTFEAKHSQVIPYPPPEVSVQLEKVNQVVKNKFVYMKHAENKYLKYKNLKPVYENERLRYLKWIQWLRQLKEPVVWHLLKTKFEKLGIYVRDESGTSTTFYGRVPQYEIPLCVVTTKK